MVSRVRSTNASNVAHVAVASQSAPPEARCRVDTAGPVFGINDLCIELTSAFQDLRVQCMTSFFLVPLVAKATLPSSIQNDFKGTVEASHYELRFSL